jgi:LemA protein
VTGPWILAGFAAAAAATIFTFNRLTRSRERAREAWSGIDVQLQRRAALVPNLVETVRGYATHERETLEAVTRARAALTASTGAGQASETNQALTGALGRLFALAEAYPELRAADSFTVLQRELSDTEEKVAYARHFYNGNVLAYNTLVRRFPTLIVARAFRFHPEEFFEAELDAARPVDVRFDA